MYLYDVPAKPPTQRSNTLLSASETVASVCSLVLSDSSTFLKFWLTDRCRENLISALPKQDLANLRLVCHDFSTRAAPTLFGDLRITFRPGVLTRPARLAALDRVGHHVKHLAFSIPHTAESSLPPLIHPETGEEINFTYTPQTDVSNARQAKYGDEDITELLAHQYPPLFHAATNVPAFIRGLSCFVHLKHLEISCPGSEASFVHQSRRSTVDFALISLRIAIERSYMNALDTLTLSPIHPAGFFALSPLSSCGATPASARRWAGIKHLSISTPTAPPSRSPHAEQQKDASKLLTSYLSIFQPTLHTLDFTWLGAKGPLPFHKSASPTSPQHHSPARHSSQHNRKPQTDRTFHFPLITTLSITNAQTKASALRALAIQHSSTLQTLELTNVELTSGTWEEAFAPLLKTKTRNNSSQNSPPRKRHARDDRNAATATPLVEEMADIPIMFAPSTPSRNPSLNNPGPSTTRSQLRPRYPQHVHPSERFQRSSPSSSRSPTSAQETVARVHAPQAREAVPPPAAATLMSVTTATAAVTTSSMTVQKEKKSGGIFGRVARGVKRRFGGWE
jgi:hypothetical protein